MEKISKAPGASARSLTVKKAALKAFSAANELFEAAKATVELVANIAPPPNGAVDDDLHCICRFAPGVQTSADLAQAGDMCLLVL